MNLIKIFEMQKELDNKIREKSLSLNPTFNKEDFIVQKTLALLIEAAEYVNEVQSFKYWKLQKNVNKLAVTEEFADLIHFLVNFAYKFDVLPEIEPKIINQDINIQFQHLFISLANIMKKVNKSNIEYAFQVALGSFVMLGFTYEDLYDAYVLKNQKNYDRIKNNY
ncbi:dUTP diphosphatase [Mycoplasma sp. 888]|uniref:dUTP diphosphatase n=1 Tax=Mycoplasma sp. 888 TaxID=3108483 RepID=UPI002D79A6E7|nr:dUTP diphosphatase [Mycoplasma sp. 888]WRQ25685.1 dUTP diphosphatase [Mycoplasma sp. 888]